MNRDSASSLIDDRSHKAFRKRIQRGRPRRQRYAGDARIVDDLHKGGTELGVAVMDEIRTRLEESPLLHGGVARHLYHPLRMRMQRHPGDVDATPPQRN